MPASPSPADLSVDLALAVILTSDAPLLLLNSDLAVVAASRSFCRAFRIDPITITGLKVSALGSGEWDIPQLESLLQVTASGAAAVEDYEMDLRRPGQPIRKLLVNAHRLEQGSEGRTLVLLSVSDQTEARARDAHNADLMRDKATLMAELQHRVANSLQIIASVLMQSAKRVQSDETRTHLYDAHNRVMSVAALQSQLSAAQVEDVELRPYFTNLCRSIGSSMIRDRDSVILEAVVDGSEVKAEVSLNLGLIVTELVINALKHAFPGQRSGRITLDFRSEGEDWTLTVTDDGIGMPGSAADAKPGLGTSIVKALTTQLDATVGTADAGPGTIVTVRHRASDSAFRAPGAAAAKEAV